MNIQLKSFGLLLVMLVMAACNTKAPPPPTPKPPVVADTTAPAAPLWSKVVPGDAQVELGWQANSEPDLAGYTLYWGVDETNLDQSVSVGTEKLGFLVSGLENGKTYYFALEAADTSGNLSPLSKLVKAIPEVLILPPPPPPPVAGDFEISAAKEVSITKGQGKNLLVSIARNNFPDEVSFSLESAPAGISSDLPKATKEDQLELTLNVAGGGAIAAGDHEVKLMASANGISKVAKVMVKVEEAVIVLPPPPPPAAGDFSFAPLGGVIIAPGEGKSVAVKLVRNAFEGEINLSLKSAPAGVSSDLPKATAGDQVLVMLNVAGGGAVAAGDYEVEFEASAKGISKVGKMMLKVQPVLPPPPVGDFSISTQETLILKKGENKNLTINIARNNFPDSIGVKVKSAPAGVSTDLPKNTVGDKVELNLSVAGGASPDPGQYDVVFEATAKGISKTATLKLTVQDVPVVVHPKPEVDLVKLEGITGNEVRQGYGNVILNVEGKHLAGINQASLEKQFGAVGEAGVLTIPVQILSKTDTTLKLQTTIQHGAPTGTFDLTVVNGSVVKKKGVLVVTPIFAAPSGNDASGKGTFNQPFRSLTKAVSVATSADTIRLGEGEFNKASGEVFPINVSGMNIEGKGNDKTILGGLGATESCLVVSEGKADTRLTDLWVKGCSDDGIRLDQGKTFLLWVKVSDGKLNGMRLLGGAEAVIVASQFKANQTNGIIAGDTSKLTFEGDQTTKLHDNLQSGLYMAGSVKLTGQKLSAGGNLSGLRISGLTSTVTLSESEFLYNRADGILIENSQQVMLNKVGLYNNTRHGLHVMGNTSLEFNGLSSSSNDGDGIHVNVAANETADLKLNGVIVDLNGQSGIEYRSANPASKLTMTDSKVEKNTTYGLYIAGKPTTIVLGLLKPGNNTFRDNGSTYLVDARDANTGTMFAVGNTFATGGLKAAVSGLKNGPASQLPNWQIVNVGNKISFGAL